MTDVVPGQELAGRGEEINSESLRRELEVFLQDRE